MIRVPGYSPVRNDRVGRLGGGVAFYVHNSIGVAVLKQSSMDAHHRKPEFLIIGIIFNNASNLLLAVVYRPPNCGYLSEFINIFLDLQIKYRHYMIFGDFNADMNVILYDSTQLHNFITSAGMYLVPYGSTHHLRNSTTFLDLCIIDDVDKLINYGKKAASFLSAHDLINVVYNINIERRLRKVGFV